MILKNRNELWNTTIPLLIIAVIIFIFNIISIWGFDGLMTDDQGYFFSLYDKSISDLAFRRNIFHALFTLGIIKIASLSSVFFARFLILFLLSIPCAFLIYYFSHFQYQLKKHTAVAIAVLPFILPNEVRVPTYIVGSYMLLAILFSLISIYFILRFSKQSRFLVIDFILAATAYYVATESSELIASMLPVFLFLIFIFKKLSVKQILLGSIISFVAIRKIIHVVYKPYGGINDVSNDIPVSEIKNRIIHFMDFTNPFHIPTNIGIMNIILISIVILGAIMVILNHDRLKNILYDRLSSEKPPNKYFFIVYYYLFPLAWLVLSAIPFLLYSQHYTSRYFSMTSIAVSFLFVTSISVIVGSLTNHKMPLLMIIVLIIVLSGLNRQIHFIKGYQTPKYQFANIKQTLTSYNLPEDVQIIIAAPGNIWLAVGNGVTDKSNGTFQYILKRRDVQGQIMVEKSFYDPFRLFNKPWEFRSVDIDTTKITYIFRRFHKDSSQNRRLHYALRWVDEKSKDSPWSIFHFNDQGYVSNLISGNGYEYYELTVDSLLESGITRKDIMFGGNPTTEDSLRLGL